MTSVARDRLDRSVRSAIGFLSEHQSSDQLWRDFRTLAGESVDWVSAVVLHALAEAGGPSDRLFGGARALMFRQRQNGGWAYADGVPTDCDSTAWTLLSLGELPIWRPSALWRAAAYLRRHQRQDSGGFTTYAPEDGIDRYIGMATPGLTEGWLAPHVCVTAVAVQALAQRPSMPLAHLQPALDMLKRSRKEDGTWTSYWWEGFSYATYHVARSLLIMEQLSRTELRRTQASVLALQRPDGGWSDRAAGRPSEVFATAHAVLTLLLDLEQPISQGALDGVQWLLHQHRRDGSWPTVPILRIPPPMQRSPEQVERWRENDLGTGVLVADHRRLFTTAAALRAVSRFRNCSLAPNTVDGD